MRDALQSLLNQIETLHPKPIDLGLDRVSQVFNKLIPNEFECPVVTIAGTNGKGSTAAALTALAQAAGKTVGTYTSPHLIRFNERITLNGKPISDADAFSYLKHVLDGKGEVSLTYFEIVTLAALLYFYEQKPDLIILEVGMGGRLDAVNVVDPTLCIITHIGLDHTQWLGETKEKIATEKAGIMRAGCPVLIGAIEMAPFLKNKAEAMGAMPEVLEQDFPMIECSGHLHPRSLSLAARAAQHLKYHFNFEAAEKVLSQVTLPGRFQVISHDGKTVILDVAHNEDGILALCRRLKQTGVSPLNIVLGVLEDKALEGILEPLRPWAHTFYCCTPNSPRATTSQTLAKHIGDNARAFDKPQTAFLAALKEAGDILVTGSFYTVGDIARTLAVCYNQEARIQGALC